MRIHLVLTLVALGACKGTTEPDTDSDTDADTDTDTDADTDSDTDADTDSDTDADTDSDTDTDTDTDTDPPNIPVVQGTPIAGGCLDGLVPVTPAAALTAPTLSQEGEMAFDGTHTCAADSWSVTFEEANFSDPPTAATFDAWDLSDGSWHGEVTATMTAPETWTATTPATTCAQATTTMFTAVGFDGATPSRPTGTADPNAFVDVLSAGYNGSTDRAIGTVLTSAVDEMWVWAVYPEHDQAFGPFELFPSGTDFTVDFELGGNNLVYDGMVFGFVGCSGGNIVGVAGR